MVIKLQCVCVCPCNRQAESGPDPGPAALLRACGAAGPAAGIFKVRMRRTRGDGAPLCSGLAEAPRRAEARGPSQIAEAPFMEIISSIVVKA